MDLVMSAPSRGDTVVGNDVWLGYEALVLPGVTIGDGAIVAAGSVVAADVPPYAIVAGNPARVVRRRYEDADVERLLRAAWWDWPAELVTEHARTIMSGEPRRAGADRGWRARRVRNRRASTAVRAATLPRHPARACVPPADTGSSRTGAPGRTLGAGAAVAAAVAAAVMLIPGRGRRADSRRRGGPRADRPRVLTELLANHPLSRREAERRLEARFMSPGDDDSAAVRCAVRCAVREPRPAHAIRHCTIRYPNGSRAGPSWY